MPRLAFATSHQFVLQTLQLVPLPSFGQLGLLRPRVRLKCIEPCRIQSLAQRREIRKLADRTRAKGTTIVPLKMYFVRGRVKLLVGVARGKRHADKRQDLGAKEARREIERAMSKRR